MFDIFRSLKRGGRSDRRTNKRRQHILRPFPYHHRRLFMEPLEDRQLL